MSQKTIMVLGAGLSGLCAAKRALENNFLVTVYEKDDQMGGLWYKNEDMNRVCMYEGLMSNQPKPVMEYSDFFFEGEDQYFTPKQVQDYLVAYAKKFKVDEVVKLQHEVMEVRPARDTKGEWQVTVKNHRTNETEIKFFDFVVICNGHYSKPLLPVIPGQDVFTGDQMSSIKYRKALPFRGKRVLVIGSGLSAMDIAFLLTKECSEVYFGQKTFFDLNFPMPENLNIRPVVKEITESGAIFEDDSNCVVDVIIYATGYEYDFPFLHPDCGITVKDNTIHDLYKHCLNIKYPTMGIIGMPYQVLPQLLFDLQSQFCIKFWKGDKELPTKELMLEDTRADLDKRLALGWEKRRAHKMSELAPDYHNDLSDTAGLERTKPVFFKIAKYFGPATTKDYLNYRKEFYEVLDDESFRTYWK